jgi:glycosyltransferase involved in cell wall biosynthesis
MSGRSITIGYVCMEDPRDRRTWSGTNYHLLHAMERAGHGVEVFAPLRPQPELFVARSINFLSTRIGGKRFNYRDSHLLSRGYARILEPALRDRPVDLLIAPAGLATTALLDTPIPIVHVNDRCLHGALGYHKILRNLYDFSRIDNLTLERKALENAALTIYASDWATEAARKASPATAERIRTIPFGANFEQEPAPPEARTRPGEPWELLFLGVNWEDKGGPIALDALRRLRAKGQRVRLTVAGCAPPPQVKDADLRVVGFLDKNNPAQRQQLEGLLRHADALVLPTRFEAYGIVCCEAAAYGLPVFATRTGGIPTIVQEGLTGRLMDPSDDGDAYAQAIDEVLASPERWRSMRTAARARYEAVLNWDAFVRELFTLVADQGLMSNAR